MSFTIPEPAPEKPVPADTPTYKGDYTKKTYKQYKKEQRALSTLTHQQKKLSKAQRMSQTMTKPKPTEQQLVILAELLTTSPAMRTAVIVERTQLGKSTITRALNGILSIDTYNKIISVLKDYHS